MENNDKEDQEEASEGEEREAWRETVEHNLPTLDDLPPDTLPLNKDGSPAGL